MTRTMAVITQIFLVFSLLLIPCSAYSTTNESSNNQSKEGSTLVSLQNASDNISLDIASEYAEITDEFQNVRIFVNVYTTDEGIVKLILEQKNSSGATFYKSSQLINTTQYTFYLHPGEIGVYQVKVNAIQNGNFEEAYTTYKVISLYDTNTVRFLALSLAFFAALLILIGISKENTAKEEILRFIFLSGIVGSILAALLFTEIQFGQESPLGLVLQNQTTTDNSTRAVWVFNVGTELSIPLYVIVFGLIGGYLRYLYKTSRVLTDDELRKEREDVKKYLTSQGISDVSRRIIFFESLKDVALFFLAPILATVVWFLFSQWEPIEDSATLLAVFSFASGLVSTDIINTITDFTKTNLSRRNTSSS